MWIELPNEIILNLNLVKYIRIVPLIGYSYSLIVK